MGHGQVRFHPLYPEILASGSLDHEVRIWDAHTADCIGSRNFCNFSDQALSNYVDMILHFSVVFALIWLPVCIMFQIVL